MKLKLKFLLLLPLPFLFLLQQYDQKKSVVEIQESLLFEGRLDNCIQYYFVTFLSPLFTWMMKSSFNSFWHNCHNISFAAFQSSKENRWEALWRPRNRGNQTHPLWINKNLFQIILFSLRIWACTKTSAHPYHLFHFK